MMKSSRTKPKILLVILIALLGLVFTTAFTSPTPIVRVTLFYSPYCGHCEYVMTEVATRKEVDKKIGKLTEYVVTEVAKKSEVNGLRTEVIGLKTELNDFKSDVNQKMDILITGQDKQAKQLEDLKTEQIATNATLMRHEKRITFLEQK